jgi:hypothetical protein
MDRTINQSPNVSIAQRDTYWFLRSEISSAISRNWDSILDACPEIAAADATMQIYLYRNPKKAFQVFRPEDLDATHQHGGRMFFR